MGYALAGAKLTPRKPLMSCLFSLVLVEFLGR
jgi:hypothetical protein